MSTINIAIIGAGPAGCMLARLLLSSISPSSSNLKITIFESEPAPDFRAQGGTLDLHPKTGLAALKAAGLYDEFLKHARFDGSALRICDKKGKTYFKLAPSKDGNPEIDRLRLRTLLLAGLGGEGRVTWGHKLVGVEGREGGEGLHLRFENGVVKRDFDLVVGADGGWSKTRRYLDPLQKPKYSGISKYALHIPGTSTAAAEASKLVNRGSLFGFGDGKSITGQQLGEGNVNVGAFVQFDTPPEKSLTKEEIAAQFEDWSDELQGLIENAELESTIYNLHHLPEGYRWSHKSGVTLLGDAAHLMTPFAGEGVNFAFEDAMKLSKGILDGVEKGSKEALDANVKVYEEDMFKRAVRAQQMTNGMMGDMFFTEGAPRTSMQSWLVRRVAYDIGERWLPVVYPFLWAVFFGGYAVLRSFH